MRRRSNVPPPIVKVPVRKLPSYPRRTRFRRSRFTGAAWVLAAVILLILAGGGVFLYRTMSQPAELTGSLGSIEGIRRPDCPRAGRDRSDRTRLRQHAARAHRWRRLADRQRARRSQLDEGGGFTLYLLPEWTEVRLVATDADGRLVRDARQRHADAGAGRPPGDDGGPRPSVGLGQPGHPPAGPRPHRARPHQRRGARHQGRGRRRRLRQQRAAGRRRSARRRATTTPARRSTSCTASGCGSSAGSSTSSTRRWPAGRGRTAAPR